jgi:hypothetical protein
MASVHPYGESTRPTRIALVDVLKKHIRGSQSERIAEQYSRRLDVLAENVELSLGGGKTMAVASLLDTCAKMQGVADPANELEAFRQSIDSTDK